MSMAFRADQPIGEIVAVFPTAGLVFKRHRIDFCCGGDRPLEAAVQASGLNVEDIMTELQSAFETAEQRKHQSPFWNEAAYGELVDHIIETHHGYLKRELGELGEFVQRIHRVHGSGHPELAKLDELYRAFRAELEQHMAKEEAYIFPLVHEYERTGSRETLAQAVAVIQELEAEHQTAGNLLGDMRDATSDYQLPSDACATYTVSFRKLEELEDDMFQHIHLENNILFPRLERELKNIATSAAHPQK